MVLFYSESALAKILRTYCLNQVMLDFWASGLGRPYGARTRRAFCCSRFHWSHVFVRMILPRKSLETPEWFLVQSLKIFFSNLANSGRQGGELYSPYGMDRNINSLGFASCSQSVSDFNMACSGNGYIPHINTGRDNVPFGSGIFHQGI